MTTGILAAAGIGAALLFTAGEAEATPVNIPGIGQFEISDEIAAQFGLTAPAPELGTAEAPAAEQAIIETYEFRPVTIPGVGTTPTQGMAAIPDQVAPAAVAEPLPAQQFTSPAPEFRQVRIAGLGDIAIPSGLPPLVGIPGVSDGAGPVPAPMPAAMPKRTVGERAAEAARTRLGASYSTGAVGPDAFDCSGLVQWSYRQAGVELPRTSYSQLAAGTPVSVDELQPGDLVSYYGGGHSALYVGDGQVVHAASYGSGVKLSPVDNMPITGARRF
ncbi:NlpC/P60 family protein [Nocardia sp. NBC_01503]|uniref:C40 family peptidase n=1 Tax=Nocardia sp. NBC_01503 TaxID=2975997 RepID=UPI002E7B2FFD|nr:NlpC/P60 family protein [Nocardia sp. NBC_01503]WTL35501.1 NlpC/P60 family protein [Nocardia sp. NBC_01503]